MILFPRSIGPVKVDAVIKEIIESRLKITEMPIEFGADVTDHAYVEPMRITIEGIIGGSLLTSSSGGRAVAVAAWQALKALQQSREPFTLISGLDVHRNILIESLIAERDKDHSMVLKFTADLREIQIVGSAYSAGIAGAPAGGQARGLSSQSLADGAATLKGAPDVNRGDVGAVRVTSPPPSASRNNTLLYGIFN